MDDRYGYWLSGLIDGEGSFLIQCDPRKRVFSCRFIMAMRDDDEKMVREIHRRTGIGNIYMCSARGATRPSVMWMVQSKADVQSLVQLLDRYPLRSRKAKDFKVWKRAVAEWSKFTPRHKQRSWDRMSDLALQLRSVRQYA